jgi:hypothetical protein
MDDLDDFYFEHDGEWRAWLEQNHAQTEGVHLIFFSVAHSKILRTSRAVNVRATSIGSTRRNGKRRGRNASLRSFDCAPRTSSRAREASDLIVLEACAEHVFAVKSRKLKTR